MRVVDDVAHQGGTFVTFARTLSVIALLFAASCADMNNRDAGADRGKQAFSEALAIGRAYAHCVVASADKAALSDSQRQEPARHVVDAAESSCHDHLESYEQSMAEYFRASTPNADGKWVNEREHEATASLVKSVRDVAVNSVTKARAKVAHAGVRGSGPAQQ
jgi:hypothetical protein